MGVSAPSAGALELGDVARAESELPSGPVRSLHLVLCEELVDAPIALIEVVPLVGDAMWTVAGVELTRSVTLQDI